MIGVIDIKVAAHNPNFPLEPVFTFINSAQSFRIRNVPRAVGKWNITNVFVRLSYPDNTTVQKECVLNGNIWIGTVEGCATSGTSTNGFIVTASGIDENENVITNYVLGAGDLYVKDLDGTIDPERVGTKMYFNDALPENPKKGDATFIDQTLNVYDGTNWVPVAVSPDPSFIIDADGNKIYADRTVEVVEQGQITQDELALKSDLPTKTSDLSNDSGFITAAQVPTPDKIEDLSANVIYANRTVQYNEEVANWTDTYYPESPLNWDAENNWWMANISPSLYMKLQFNSGTWTLEIGENVGGEWVIDSDSVQDAQEATVLDFDISESVHRLEKGVQQIQATGELALKSDLPTKTSDLTNDSGFITSAEIEPYHYVLTPTENTGLANTAYQLALSDQVSFEPVKDGVLSATLRTNRDLTKQFRAKMILATYYPYVMSKYNGQTLSPELSLYFCEDKLRYGTTRPRTYYEGYMFRTAGAGFAIPCSEDGTPDGRLVETTAVQGSYVLMANNTTSVHSIGFSEGSNYNTIITIDGQSDMIYAHRANAYKLYLFSEEIANKSELPTKTSDLTNDSGFITSADIPTPSYIEDANGNRINANFSAKKSTAHKTWYVTDTRHGGNKYSLTPIDNFLSAEFFPDTPVEEESWGFRIQLVQNGDDYNGTFYDYFYVNGVWEENEAWQVEFLNGETSVQCGQYFVEYSNILTDVTIATTNDLPTKTSDLTNDSGFVTSADLPAKSIPFTIKQDRTLYITSQTITVKTSPTKTLTVATNPNGNNGTFVANFLISGWNDSTTLADVVTAPDTAGCYVFSTSGQLNDTWGNLKSTLISTIESFDIALPL